MVDSTTETGSISDGSLEAEVDLMATGDAQESDHAIYFLILLLTLKMNLQ